MSPPPTPKIKAGDMIAYKATESEWRVAVVMSVTGQGASMAGVIRAYDNMVNPSSPQEGPYWELAVTSADVGDFEGSWAPVDAVTWPS